MFHLRWNHKLCWAIKHWVPMTSIEHSSTKALETWQRKLPDFVSHWGKERRWLWWCITPVGFFAFAKSCYSNVKCQVGLKTTKSLWSASWHWLWKWKPILTLSSNQFLFYFENSTSWNLLKSKRKKFAMALKNLSFFSGRSTLWKKWSLWDKNKSQWER